MSINTNSKELLIKSINKIRAWHKTAESSYPWRNVKSPFHILVAELMLQRTNPTRVVPIFNDFISKIKTPDDALKNPKLVQRHFIPLGLQKRADLLIKTCKILVENNLEIIPNYNFLVGLPGIGDYTAAATMLFAFDMDIIAVDTNVERFLTRTQIIKLKKNRNKSLINASRFFPGVADIPTWNRFGIAIIDFSMKICRKKPECVSCPLRNETCKFEFQEGELKNNKLGPSKISITDSTQEPILQR